VATVVKEVSAEVDPIRDLDAERLLTKLGFKWQLIAEMPLEEIDAKASLGNQARFDAPLHEETVEEYAANMKAGDVFPAIVGARVGNRKRALANGNHRYAAAQRVDRKTFPYYEVLGVTRQQQFTMLTFRFNREHGLPLTEKEKVQHAIWFMDAAEMSLTDAARAVGIKPDKLALARKRIEGDRRARMAEVNMGIWEGIRGTRRDALLGIPEQMGEAFGDSVVLTHAAALDQPEIKELVAALRRTRTRKGQQDVISSFREVHRDRIQTEAGGGVVRPKQGKRSGTVRSRAASGVGLILSLPQPAEIVDTYSTAAEAEEFAAKVERAIQYLDDLLRALEKKAG
jgi:hypothetical protein